MNSTQLKCDIKDINLAEQGKQDVFNHYNTERMKKDYVEFYNNAIDGKYDK